jgi:hypothetical protein
MINVEHGGMIYEVSHRLGITASTQLPLSACCSGVNLETDL